MSEVMHQKQLWYVLKDFIAKRGISSDTRKVVVEAGEVLYIQNPYEWHFRTLNGDYLVAPEDELLRSCQLLGEVFDNVAFQANMPPLAMILHYRQYTEADRALNITLRGSLDFQRMIHQSYKLAAEREIKYMDKRREK